MKLSDISIHAWIQEHGIKTETGKPLDFHNHLFLFEPYRDFHPKQVTLKAAQVGFTTMAIVKNFFVAEKYGLDTIYTMPSASDVQDLVGSKVNRLLSNNPHLQRLVKDKDSITQKVVGKNIIQYRGTWTETQAISLTSDLNIHDEEDRSKQEIIAQFTSRLQHSAFKWEWHFSNPSVEGNGVSRYWPLSDQRHWFITCSACKKEQYLKWPESINRTTASFVCRYCQVALTEEDRRKGRWVAKYKDREWRGYWISLLMAPWVTAAEIIKLYETKSQEYFWNFVLGLPYVGEGNTVTPDVIFRNLVGTINSQQRVVIGCDSGLIKHFVLGNAEGLFYYGKTDTWKTIEGFLHQYPQSVAVIDALPDLTEPRKLREKYPGRVYLTHYARDRKTDNFIRWGKNEEEGGVVADRNRMIQLVIDEFADRRIPLQGTQDDWADYYAHWNDIYRVNEMEEAKQAGNKNYVYITPFRWDTKTGMDHWVHATVYWRIGMDRFGGDKGQLITSDSLSFPIAPVASPDGTMKAPNPKQLFRFEDKPNDDWRQ